MIVLGKSHLDKAAPLFWNQGSQRPVPIRKWARAANPLNLVPGRKNQYTSAELVKSFLLLEDPNLLRIKKTKQRKHQSKEGQGAIELS